MRITSLLNLISITFLLILSSCNYSSLTNEDSINYNETVIEREFLFSSDCIGGLGVGCSQIIPSLVDGWFAHPDFPGCEIYYEPNIYMCIGEVTSFYVGDLNILDLPGAVNPPLISV